MFRYVIALCLMGLSSISHSHQFTPTYPKFEQSFVQGVVYTKMQLFNKRREVKFYETIVYDGDWKPISFASESKIVEINYLQSKDINVYIKQEDLKRVVYICSESKVPKDNTQSTLISSRICSKVK